MDDLDAYRDMSKAMFVKLIDDGWVISVHRYSFSDGWVKNIRTGRCRVDGDPKRESIGWPR